MNNTIRPLNKDYNSDLFDLRHHRNIQSAKPIYKSTSNLVKHVPTAIRMNQVDPTDIYVKQLET